ncbi:MAG: hypothetical protein FJY75_13670 [Candidatus Eisenbacteria bacterium]|uniref:MrpA C-terminal/MbhE domain-containing protein n=1 Tax=Eiseniibacteriota bacterium TaxID=2212470 RepID=A0A937XAZ0_UNCEI|nr:hypothetical protein [Candidatus Eisenbacteria bacterium]
MRWVVLLVVGLACGLLATAAMELPRKGDPGSPASVGVAAAYTARAMAETKTPNIVTAVLADYRGYDTMGESFVVFSAALACLLILVPPAISARGRREDAARAGRGGAAARGGGREA